MMQRVPGLLDIDGPSEVAETDTAEFSVNVRDRAS